MLPWHLLDTAAVPGSDEPMKLWRRGTDFSIRVGPHELMNNRVHGSEDALAQEAIVRLARRDGIRVLVGGLGMGFTLVAALAECGPRSEVVVAELVPAVVAWHRGPLAGVSGGALDDPRVSIRTEDVGAVMAAGKGAYDAILLDVDNGPAGLTRAGNDRLYGPRGLAIARAALRPGGILAIWSAGADDAFTRRFRQAQFEVELLRVRGRGKAGERFVIWIGRR